MVDIIEENAEVLIRELEWFSKVIETRIQIHFGHESEYEDIFDLELPEHSGRNSMYAEFIRHYDLTYAERVVFMLGLVPHIRPQLLDVFFTKNADSLRYFTEFGGRNGHHYLGFLPTGETALFLLAGDDLKKRMKYFHLFDHEHFFARHNILRLERTDNIEPELNGYLTISSEVKDLVITGNIRTPAFNYDFPAKKIETELHWSDLVLNPHAMEQVLEIKAWIEHGHIILNDFGLGKRLRPGYKCLFYGPPGTGKTMTASLLGKTTDSDVYKIDLSMVVSKYIGETEKNLEKIFSKAENRNWILFFDEADALFGRRTAINSAHDRFANQEVSYLLQRVEEYQGVVILSSNLKSNIDEAFMRRFQSVIYFPVPGYEERLKLWMNSFSMKMLPDSSVNLQEIASEYEISGGAIMNAVRYSTLMAVSKGRENICLDDILEGIRRELQKEGRTS